MSKEENNSPEPSDEWYEHFSVKVDPGQTPVRIDKFVFDKMEQTSRNRIQNAIKAGAILVNDKLVKSNYKVRPNDYIKVILPKPPEDQFEITPENIPLDIRYEDDDLLVVYKAPGMVVHPGVGNYSGTLVNALAYYFKQTDLPILEGNRLDRPGLVHRIDKNTSGLLVIAKTDFAMTHLASQFFDHSIEREYMALVWGNFDDAKGTIEGNIGRHPRERKKMCVFENGEEGKHAVTHYELLEDLYYVSLVKCNLETGRTHQIRVHMSHIGHPIFNDDRYGGDRVVKGTVFSKYKQFVANCFDMLPRHALHARSLGFIHPRTKEFMKFEAEAPEDFQATLNKWRSYLQSRKGN
jgi:23S rRNA pseudouridine1911/1915/1917 synthase